MNIRPTVVFKLISPKVSIMHILEYPGAFQSVLSAHLYKEGSCWDNLELGYTLLCM